MNEDRAVEIAIRGLRDLMEANFRTVHVQLEQLAKMSPDVEELKRDVAELRAQGAADQKAIDAVNEAFDHIGQDYMRRDEIIRDFVPRSAIDAKSVSARNAIALAIAFISLLSSVGLGIINAF